jgi:hypothetical protein
LKRKNGLTGRKETKKYKKKYEKGNKEGKID